MRKLLLLAGEESGLIYASRIAHEMRERFPDIEIRGYADYGFETGDLAVFGIFAVLRHIFFFLRVKRTMMRAIDEWRPDAVCTVDYPGMNLKLAAHAKSKGIRAVHVVCPQVWAWHQGRIPKIEASLDRLCCFFPFEPALFRPGFAEFVGHPLATDVAADPSEACCTGDPSERRLIAMLPGSRIGEIEKILPTLLCVVQTLAGRCGNLRFVIPAANARARRRIDAIVKSFLSPGLDLRVIDGRARETLRSAVCAVVASGTATLEAALVRCPTVLVYRVSALTALIARHVIKGVKHVGLVNIVAEKAGRECPMPELLQEDFTVENVASHLLRWLDDPKSRAQDAEKLDRLTALLESDFNPLGRVVDIVSEGVG